MPSHNVSTYQCIHRGYETEFHKPMGHQGEKNEPHTHPSTTHAKSNPCMDSRPGHSQGCKPPREPRTQQKMKAPGWSPHHSFPDH